jgi:hypothetical protein
VLLVEIPHDRSLETAPDVLGELAEVAIVLALALLQGAEGSHCVFDPQEEVGVVGPLVGAIHQAEHFGEALPQQAGAISVGVDSQLDGGGPELVALSAVGAVIVQRREINIDHLKLISKGDITPNHNSQTHPFPWSLL